MIGRTKRILFVADHLGYGGGVWHGCTTYLINVLPRLRSTGHRVSLCCLRAPHESAKALIEADVDVTFLDLKRFDLRAVPQLLEVAREFRPDVIHAHQRLSSMIARSVRISSTRPKIALHIHDSDSVSALERAVNRLLPQPDVALCVCGAVSAAAHREHGVQAGRLKILLNAVNTAHVKPRSEDARKRLRTEWAVPLDSPVVVSTSRFWPEKRLVELVQMIPAVLSQVPTARFVFAGEGPERTTAMQLARKLGVEQCMRFLGHRTDIPDVVTACDVTTLLCLKEACSYAIIESLVLGRPVVAYSAGGNPELVTHGHTGLLATEGDDRGFVDSLVTILSDASLQQRLSKTAVQEVDRFDIRHHVAALEATYESICDTYREQDTLEISINHPNGIL